MNRKPWPIVILAFTFFLIPIFNIVGTFFFIDANVSFFEYLAALFNLKNNGLFLFYLIIPSFVAGVAIYLVKKWSYLIFLICMGFISFQVIFSYSEGLSFIDLFFLLIIPLAINLLYVSYILLPEVRATYFDPRLRWWESKPRYFFETDIQISFENEMLSTETMLAKLSNISVGGLFVIMPKGLGQNSHVNLKFEIFGIPLELKAKIVYIKPDHVSCGLQFIEVTKKQNKTVKQIIDLLVKNKCQETRPRPLWTEDLLSWIKTVLKTGRGLTPEVNLKRSSKNNLN